jgi:single stranded DNA-binding protein
MMMQNNRFEVSGFLTAKPSIRTLPSGTLVANVRLGQTYQYEARGGPKRHTNWFNLAFYNHVAEIAMNFEKGDNLNVIGTVQQRQFTPKDGSTRTVYELVVQSCHLLRRSPSSQQIEAPVMPGPTPAPSAIEAITGEEGTDAWAVL